MNKDYINSDKPSAAVIADRIIEVLLATLLITLPLSLGGVKAWGREIAIILSGTIILVFTAKLIFVPGAKIVRTWAYLPLALFILIVTMQLLPIPEKTLATVSAHTVELKQSLLNGSKYSQPSSLSTISFYPDATRADLRMILAIAAVFVVVLNSYTTIRQVKRLLSAVAFVGGLIALLFLAQDLFGNGKIFWLIPTKHGNAPSGTFANHSHFSQFMNLSAGACLALLLMKLATDFKGKSLSAPAVFDYLCSSSSRSLWILAAVIILIVTSVFICLSRGGMISMIIAALLTTFIISVRKPVKGYGWIIALIALAAFACILYTSFDAVYDRLATVKNFESYENRWQILKDLTACFRQFPLFGTGLGTHSVIYPMYDSSNITALATHVENEYAQALEETGLAGLAVLVVFAAIIFSNYVKKNHSHNPSIVAANAGLGFGLIAVLTHSFSDFGQHIPANAFISATFCALILALNNIQKNNTLPENLLKSDRKLYLPAAAALLAVIGIWIWALQGADHARIAEANWNKVLKIEKQLVANHWQADNEQYSAIISHASDAVINQPQNINYRYWLNIYRWHQVTSQSGGNCVINIPEQSLAIVEQIANDLDMSRTFCPTFGPVYCLLGQLQKFILDKPEGTQNIKKALCLAPCDPIVCFVAGFSDIMDENIDQSLEKFKRAAALDGSLFKDIATTYINQADRPDLALAAAGDDIEKLNWLEQFLSDSNQETNLIEQVKTKQIYLLEKQCRQTHPSPSALITLADTYIQQKENLPAAADLYQRAVSLDYNRLDWRLKLVKLLAQTGNIKEACLQARICLKICPQLKEAERLLAELSLQNNEMVKTN